MDIAISLILLAVVLTPLYLVIRDLWTTKTRRRQRRTEPTSPMQPATSTFPSLSLLEEMEDTMPACLRRTEWDQPQAWMTDPRHPENAVVPPAFARRQRAAR
jgi:hypothetical protein